MNWQKGSELGVFDVHYHLIFGVDDGPKTIDDSLALAEASIAEGVTHIVATPHSNHKYEFQPEINREKLDILNQRLGGRLTLGLGCDFHLAYHNIVDLEQHPSRYTLNGKQYLLVEFADYSIPRHMSDVLFKMRGSGIIPVITHPERNPLLTADLQRLMEWVASGCIVQVTAGSFTDDFGRKPRATARELVQKNLVHLVASDAHSVKWRPPAMRKAYKFLCDEFGQATADRLCIDNPRAVFFGEKLPPQPEFDFDDIYGGRRNRGFFARLLGK